MGPIGNLNPSDLHGYLHSNTYYMHYGGWYSAAKIVLDYIAIIPPEKKALANQNYPINLIETT